MAGLGIRRLQQPLRREIFILRSALCGFYGICRITTYDFFSHSHYSLYCLYQIQYAQSPVPHHHKLVPLQPSSAFGNTDCNYTMRMSQSGGCVLRSWSKHGHTHLWETLKLLQGARKKRARISWRITIGDQRHRGREFLHGAVVPAVFVLFLMAVKSVSLGGKLPGCHS